MNPAFTEFMESSCLALAREVPEFPTQMGMFEIAGEAVPQNYFTGIDAESVTRRQQLLQSIGNKLILFPREDLDASEQLSADILDFLVNNIHERGLIGKAGKDFLQHEYLIRPSVGLQSDLPIFLTDLHPMRHAGDAQDYISRLKSIASHLLEADQQIRQRQSAGLLPPALVLQDSIEEIERFIATAPEQNILFSALTVKSAEMQGLNEPSRNTLLNEAAGELAQKTYPAYQQLLATLQEQVPQAADEPGVWRLPYGDAWYEFQLRCATTTTMSATEIHELGLEETHRLEQEIIKACRDMGIKAKSIKDCHRALDADKEAPREDTEGTRQAIIDQIETLIEDIEPRLPALFHKLPKGRITVKAIPRFAEAHVPAGLDDFLFQPVGFFQTQAITCKLPSPRKRKVCPACAGSLPSMPTSRDGPNMLKPFLPCMASTTIQSST